MYFKVAWKDAPHSKIPESHTTPTSNLSYHMGGMLKELDSQRKNYVELAFQKLKACSGTSVSRFAEPIQLEQT